MRDDSSLFQEIFDKALTLNALSPSRLLKYKSCSCLQKWTKISQKKTVNITRIMNQLLLESIELVLVYRIFQWVTY